MGTNDILAGQSKIGVTPILSADVNSAGQPIVFPQRDGHVEVALYKIPPGAMLPTHEHPFPRMGYVLSGLLRVTRAETGETATYRAGEFVLEAVGQWHEGGNAGERDLELLVIDLVEKGAQTTHLKP